MLHHLVEAERSMGKHAALHCSCWWRAVWCRTSKIMLCLHIVREAVSRAMWATHQTTQQRQPKDNGRLNERKEQRALPAAARYSSARAASTISLFSNMPVVLTPAGWCGWGAACGSGGQSEQVNKQQGMGTGGEVGAAAPPTLALQEGLELPN